MIKIHDVLLFGLAFLSTFQLKSILSITYETFFKSQAVQITWIFLVLFFKSIEWIEEKLKPKLNIYII